MSDERGGEGVLVYEPSKVSWVTAEFIRTPPLWMARVFILALATLIVTMTIYASLAKVAIHIDARGQLRTEPRIMPILLPSTMTIAKLNVHEQQVVQKGDVLIIAEEDVSQEDLRTVKSQPKGQIDPAIAASLHDLQEKNQHRSVLAPIGGLVHHVSISGEGQIVAAGSEVLQILPKDAVFVAELAVANQDISQLAVGLPVIVNLDAFPERTYGTINGIIQEMPLTLSAGDANSPPAYMVTVRLDRQSLKRGNEDFPFRDGMLLQGRVVTRHESMLVNALHKLFGIADDLGS